MQSPVRKDTRGQRPLLERVLDSPELARVVPQLPPEVLHRVVQRCGLEDSGEVLMLATPAQLASVFDLDLWRAGEPGADERFDADRFGVWLEVLMQAGGDAAAQTLAGMDADLISTALAQHVRVFDQAAGIETDDESVSCDVGRYQVVATRSDYWDAIVDLLVALDANCGDFFHRLMAGCRDLSDAGRELDGLDDLLEARDQGMFDRAYEREQRREQQGYVTPAQARAFLQMARRLPLGDGTAPLVNPIARAYFDAVAWSAELSTEDPRPAIGAGEERLDQGQGVDPVAAFVEVLLDEGVIVPPPRALLEAAPGEATRLRHITCHMRAVQDRDSQAYSARTQDLGYLANTIAAGCSLQDRAFTPQEASDAAIAVCNLGLENWPARWSAKPLPDDFLIGHDLISVFQVGWTVLHHEVSVYVAEHMVAILGELRCADPEIQRGLTALRLKMRGAWHAGTPWRARAALDVITALDMSAWATLLGLTAECPVIHAGIRAADGHPPRAIDPSAFEFIAENRQIDAVRAFMASLTRLLQ